MPILEISAIGQCRPIISVNRYSGRALNQTAIISQLRLFHNINNVYLVCLEGWLFLSHTRPTSCFCGHDIMYLTSWKWEHVGNPVTRRETLVDSSTMTPPALNHPIPQQYNTTFHQKKRGPFLFLFVQQPICTFQSVTQTCVCFGLCHCGGK